MKQVFWFVSLIVAFVGCTNQFEDFNTNKKNPELVSGESLFANAQKELADYTSNTNPYVNIFKLMSQYWTQTNSVFESNYDITTHNVSFNIYSRLYTEVLSDLKRATDLINATEINFANTDAQNRAMAIRQNKLQIIELLNVYVYAHLVDVFGAVPYSESLNINNVYPKYEMGNVIYADLFKRIQSAISKINVNYENFGSSDLYYGGNTASWLKFAHTLRIRMAITIADADSALTKTIIESSVGSAFTSNADDCAMQYLSTSPNYNQLYVDLVASGRHDFLPANTLVDEMVVLNDPRLYAYFRDPIDVSTVVGVVILDWFGGYYGEVNSYDWYSHISATIEQPDFPCTILSYTELCFYLAEAAERGYTVGANAETWYNRGITASFDYWKVAGVSAYLAKPEVAYSSASGTWRQKIGVQSWIANYIRGYEAYNNWRRLDYPMLNLPPSITNYADIPVRFTFPSSEKSLNPAQYQSASTAIGGDKMSTKIFWDKY